MRDEFCKPLEIPGSRPEKRRERSERVVKAKRCFLRAWKWWPAQLKVGRQLARGGTGEEGTFYSYFYFILFFIP